MASVIDSPYFEACLKHIINGFREFFDGFSESMAYDYDSFRIVASVVFEINALSGITLKKPTFHPGFQKRLHRGFHDFAIIIFFDPIHTDTLPDAR